MGVMYRIVPFDQSHGATLSAFGVSVPEGTTPSRNPTPGELRQVAAAMMDCKVKVWSPPEYQWWQVSFGESGGQRSEPWTCLNVSKFNGDEAAPHRVSFEKGSPALIVRVVHAISAVCGPLVIVPDNDCKTIVVKPDDDVDTLIRGWKHSPS